MLLTNSSLEEMVMTKFTQAMAGYNTTLKETTAKILSSMVSSEQTASL
jgi:hypothetical protein